MTLTSIIVDNSFLWLLLFDCSTEHNVFLDSSVIYPKSQHSIKSYMYILKLFQGLELFPASDNSRVKRLYKLSCTFHSNNSVSWHIPWWAMISEFLFLIIPQGVIQGNMLPWYSQIYILHLFQYPAWKHSLLFTSCHLYDVYYLLYSSFKLLWYKHTCITRWYSSPVLAHCVSFSSWYKIYIKIWKCIKCISFQKITYIFQLL